VRIYLAQLYPPQPLVRRRGPTCAIILGRALSWILRLALSQRFRPSTARGTASSQRRHQTAHCDCSYGLSRCGTTHDSDRGSALHPSGCLRSVPSVFLPSCGGAAPPRFRRSLWLDASPSTFLRAPAPICPLCGQGRQQAAPHNPLVGLFRRRAAPHGPFMVRLQSTGPTSSVKARHRCVYRRYPARRCHTSRSRPRCDVLLWNRAVP